MMTCAYWRMQERDLLLGWAEPRSSANYAVTRLWGSQERRP